MKLIDDVMLDGLIAKAQASPRRRVNLNWHAKLDEPVQRLFIAIEPGSYVRPHCHTEANKWEFFLVLRGELALLLFDDEGEVIKRLPVTSGGTVQGFELPQGAWHTVIATQPGSVFLEVKQGPYAPVSDKDFAPWSPAEGEERSEAISRWLGTAEQGDRWVG